MKRRHQLIGSFALLASFGCHAGPQPNAARTEPPITRTDVTATQFIAKHNKNAAAIQSLRATPSINIVNDDGTQKRRGRAEGSLAMARDKDFRLLIKYGLNHKAADIGSNDLGFWFWVDDDKDNLVYFCDAKDVDNCQLGVTLQPDWIMEAMGLREFTEQEVRTMSIKPGQTPGTLVLTQLRSDTKGNKYTKETTVREANGTIIEHKLYAGAKKELLAVAAISEYGGIRQTEPTTVQEADGTSRTIDAPADVIILPKKFRLTWVKENLSIDVAMPSPEVNPAFNEEQRLALFNEPKIPGTTRRDLAQLTPAASTAPPRTYESRPIPSSGVRIGQPEPIDNGTIKASRRAIEPAPLSDDLSMSAQPAGLVGAPIPSGSPGGIQTSTVSRFRSASLAH